MAETSSDTAVNARIIYWGIDGAGKRTSLSQVSRKLRADHRGEMREIPTRIDPTVSYTVLPIELGDIGGVRTCIDIISAPGDPLQAPTRKQLLDRADGVVFVVDSRRECIEANLASLEELRKALGAYACDLDEIPFIVQYNKRDLSDPYVIDELHRRLNLGSTTVFESVATEATGILQTLSTISKKVIRSLRGQSLSMDLATPAADAPPARTSFEPEAPLSPLETAPTALMEEAVLAEAYHPESAAIASEVRAAEAVLSQPTRAANDPMSTAGARIGDDLSIVSVGEASRADDRTVRVPIVLGDGEGETSTVVLSIRLDPLMEDPSD